MSNRQAKPESQAQPSRRGFLWGTAAAAGATAAVVSLPGTGAVETAASPDQPEAPARGGGYRLTERVKQYYKTTLV